jgi:hypothetical protein
MCAEKTNTVCAPAHRPTQNVGSKGGRKKNEKIVTIDTGSEKQFEELCKRLGFSVDFIEEDSKEVEARCNIKPGYIRIIYSYLQGLRYGIQTALLNLEELGRIQILDIETRKACTRENCNHTTHFPEEPIRIKVFVRGE